MAGEKLSQLVQSRASGQDQYNADERISPPQAPRTPFQDMPSLRIEARDKANQQPGKQTRQQRNNYDANHLKQPPRG